MKPRDALQALIASMTNDARTALDDAGMSRRRFLKGSGALIVGFSAARLTNGLGTAPGSVVAQRLDGAGSNQLDSWIAIAADGNVTAYTGKCELGHGLYTAQMQLIAEELDVPIGRVKLIQCDTALTPDQGTTSGAQSHPTNFNHGNLGLAGATAREALLQRASIRLGVPSDQLAIGDGVIALKDRSRSVGYGELVEGRPFGLTLNPSARRKRPGDWTVLGTAVPRVEFPAMVTGQFEYVHNVRVPGMVHGRVVRPPAVGATVVSVDESSVRGLPGVMKVVVKKNFVGVVAEKPWQAIQAASKLQVAWTAGSGTPGPARFLRASAQPEAGAGCTPGELQGRRASARQRVKDREGHLPLPLSNARIDRQFVRGGRRFRREGDDLVADASRPSAEEQRRARPRIAPRKCPRDIPDGIGLLRVQWRGYRVV
jgi:CO/xanthine dehydrogenase Mo-binding subunit